MEEVAAPVSCCFSTEDFRLVKMEVGQDEFIHLNCLGEQLWLCQGIVPEGFSVVAQLCQSSGFSPLKGMSLLFPPTL